MSPLDRSRGESVAIKGFSGGTPESSTRHSGTIRPLAGLFRKSHLNF